MEKKEYFLKCFFFLLKNYLLQFPIFSLKKFELGSKAFSEIRTWLYYSEQWFCCFRKIFSFKLFQNLLLLKQYLIMFGHWRTFLFYFVILFILLHVLKDDNLNLVSIFFIQVKIEPGKILKEGLKKSMSRRFLSPENCNVYDSMTK